MNLTNKNASVLSHKCRCNSVRHSCWSIALAVILHLLIPIFAQSQSARYDIKRINGIESKKINDKRQIAGNVGMHAARWEDNRITIYPGLSTQYSSANCINNPGEMAGWSIDGIGNKHAVVFKNDTSLLILSAPSWGIGEAFGINDFGDVTGYFAYCDTCRPRDRRNHAAFWRGGTIQDLGTIENADCGAYALNNWGLVVGMADEGNTFDSRVFMTTGGGLIPLETLGGDRHFAYDVNDNGMIVGTSEESNDISRAVVWNPGIQNIQTLPGIASVARAVNNSNQVVGDIQTPSGWRGFIWENGGMSYLDSLVHPDSGWVIERALDINDPGDILALGRKNNMSSYVILINGLTIIRPSLNEKWIAGEKETIRWVGGKRDQIVELAYSSDSCRTFNIIDYIDHADSGRYVWDVPQNTISKQCFIRIMDFNDPSIVDTSEVFRIKPYMLTRDSSGQYEPYRPEQDQWAFSNIPVDMFPPEWYQQFDYRGTDPFTGYSYLYAPYQLIFSSASSFPDWVSWVRAFGVDACYHRTAFPPVYSYAAVYKWYAISGHWRGSCFGIAASNALAFSYKDQFQAQYSSFPGFANPITVASDTAVKRVVNELFTHQFGEPSRELILSRWGYVSPNQTLNELKMMFKEDHVAPKTLSFGNNNGAGAHNVLPYKLVQDVTAKNFYYLSVYDNNFPNSTTMIRIDTLGNSNHGVWMPQYGNPAWGGPRKFMLMTEASDYLNDAALPKRTSDYKSPFILSTDELEIYTPIKGHTRITDTHGNITGYSHGSVLDEIPDSAPLFYFDGRETPPYGYALPTANYAVSMDNFTSDSVKTFFFTGDRTFYYHRTDAEPNQTDRLYFEGGISVSNPDPQQKTISLLTILNETSHEKMVSFSGIELASKDSIKIETFDNNKIKLTSLGTAKEYDLEINYATQDGAGKFSHLNIAVSANTAHLLEPDWPNLTGTELRVMVDHGNTGTIDDTLSLTNQPSGADDRHGSPLPKVYRLEQNYPNPFNPNTSFKFQVPRFGLVSLKIFDVLGQEVATIVHEQLPPGQYTRHWNAGAVASGVYYYRLVAGPFSDTKKLLLMK